MTDFYFDIETYSPSNIIDPENDKIITIQFQHLDTKTGKPLGELMMLKEWESSEEDIVEKFFPFFQKWEFIPIGMNLPFDKEFLRVKFKRYLFIDIPPRNLFWDFPSVDIKPLLILLNEGKFSGASLNTLGNKKNNGACIKDWYERKDYDAIVSYVRQEAEAFITFYQMIKRNIKNIFDSQT